VVNREEMIPLHSLLGLDFFLGFSLGLWPMYLIIFRFLYDSSKLFDLFLFGHRGVPWIVRSGV